jgi:hypothetical protein
MAQVLLLKINSSTGLPTEHGSTADDVTFASYTVGGGGPVLNANLDMQNGNISDVNLLSFTDPTADGITQTAGLLIADNIMAKERSNSMTTAADILFPTISDSAGQVDAFRLPVLAGTPTATPTASGEGFLVWNSSTNKLYAWDGAAWTNDIAQAASSSQSTIDSTNFVADTSGVSARDAVYVSSAGKVSPADASAESTARTLGFAVGAAVLDAAVSVQMDGVMSGFTGLTAGSRYYLSETAGAITTSVPTTSGAVVQQVGYAVSTTKLGIQIEHLGVRA